MSGAGPNDTAQVDLACAGADIEVTAKDSPDDCPDRQLNQ